MLKKILTILAIASSSLALSDSITDLIHTDISPLTIENAHKTSASVSFKPFNVDMEKCEIEFNEDLDLVANQFKEQLEEIWDNIKSDSKYFAQQLKNKTMQQAVIKIPTYIEFMMQRSSPELMAQIWDELSACVDKTVSKAAQMDLGGGSGDQGGTLKAGVKPKELMGVVECYQEAFYPSNMTADDVILLNQIEEKWKKTISALLYGQLNLVLKNFTVDRNNNFCTNLEEKKEENLAYLVDMLENQKIVLLNNKSIESAVKMEIKESENESLGISVKENEGELTEVSIKDDEIAKQALFIDMELPSFEVFKEELREYMIKLARGYEYNMNEETIFFLERMVIAPIFDEDKDDLSYSFLKLLLTLSESPEYFYEKYSSREDLSSAVSAASGWGFGDLGFTKKNHKGQTPTGLEVAKRAYANMNPLIVRGILNKTLLYAYSKGEFIRQEKMEVYYANAHQFVDANNTFLLQTLLLDRYMFRYKESVYDAIISNITTKKEVERELFFREFCMENRYEIYDDLCERN